MAAIAETPRKTGEYFQEVDQKERLRNLQALHYLARYYEHLVYVDGSNNRFTISRLGSEKGIPSVRVIIEHPNRSSPSSFDINRNKIEGEMAMETSTELGIILPVTALVDVEYKKGEYGTYNSLLGILVYRIKQAQEHTRKQNLVG